jgi:DUF4097 and DUF4098 domain-containing protein YvlB
MQPRLFPSALLLLTLPALAAAQQSSSGDLFTWSGRVASGGTLEIRHYNGPIDVQQSTSDRVEFRATRSGRRSTELTFEVENHSDGVSICGVWRGRSACDSGRRNGWDWDEGPPGSRLTVSLPKGVRLRATTGNGDVSVEKASNDLDISSGNGDVHITMTAGQVNASTGNGELDIEGATGPVKANTGNGRVYVLTSSGPVTARTGNGEIEVKMKALSSTADMTFTSGNGTVSVSLPGSFTGEIDASTGNGQLNSDFPIRVIGRLDPHHVRGTIGEGGSTRIRMSTGSGRLELRKAN